MLVTCSFIVDNHDGYVFSHDRVCEGLDEKVFWACGKKKYLTSVWAVTSFCKLILNGFLGKKGEIKGYKKE
jgi:hypothetical protein